MVFEGSDMYYDHEGIYIAVIYVLLGCKATAKVRPSKARRQYMPDIADHFLDITVDICPITFVKSKLLIEKMKSGETARVRLTGAEPLENVPRSVAEEGHEIISLVQDPSDPAGAVHILTLRKV